MKYPHIRIDDWPTGVRPILSDHIKILSRILNEFEKRKLEYVLGVVPDLIDILDIQYLKTLKYCHIAMHGFDHNYYEWNGSNNFEHPTKDELEKGLSILKNIGIVEHYIPPFNNIDSNTLSCLIDLGIKYVHSCRGVEGKIEGIMPTPKFYGRSTKLIHYIQEFTKDDIITFHITWENDKLSIFDNKWKLPELLDKIKNKL